MSSMSGSKGYGAGQKAPSGYKQYQNYTPEQMQVHQNQFDQVSPESYTSRLAGGDQALFDEIEAPAFRQFNELQAQNASRFSNMGMGARRGSGFQNFQNQATSNFAQDLQSKRQSLQQQAIKDLMSMSSDLLSQEPYSLYEKKKKPSFWESIVKGGAPLAGGAVGGYFAGLPGAKYGMDIGNSFSQGLNNG